MLELTALDRCDACGARAHHKATKPGLVGMELLFCNHHYREQRDVLLNEYWLIESDVLQSEPVPATELQNGNV
jgi:hypothetical protein